MLLPTLLCALAFKLEASLAFCRRLEVLPEAGLLAMPKERGIPKKGI